jgi:SAM-dependent methyltransferase
MRHAALEFARDVAENFPIVGPVVEMGARAAAGQEDIANVRGLFGEVEYLGCDIQEGLGVDRIEDIHELSFDDESVGTIVCLETLEHVADPLRAVQEMHRVLRPGGVLAISSLMFFPIHAHPWDFWRFTPEGFDLLLRPFPSHLVLAHGVAYLPEGVYGIGVKGADADLGPHRLPRVDRIRREWGSGQSVDFGPMRMTTRELWRYTLQATRGAVGRKLGRNGSVAPEVPEPLLTRAGD